MPAFNLHHYTRNAILSERGPSPYGLTSAQKIRIGRKLQDMKDTVFQATLTYTNPSNAALGCLGPVRNRRRHGKHRAEPPVPRLYHFDPVTGTIGDFYWPCRTDGVRVEPEGYQQHRREYLFQYPCCFCAYTNGLAYTESRVYLLERKDIKNPAGTDAWKLPFVGEYVAECADQTCGYFSPLERFYGRSVLLYKCYGIRPLPLQLRSSTPLALDLGDAIQIQTDHTTGPVASSSGQIYPNIVRWPTDHPEEPRALGSLTGRLQCRHNNARRRTSKPVLEAHDFSNFSALFSSGVSESDFWSLFLQCSGCGKIISSIVFNQGFHKCSDELNTDRDIYSDTDDYDDYAGDIEDDREGEVEMDGESMEDEVIEVYREWEGMEPEEMEDDDETTSTMAVEGSLVDEAEEEEVRAIVVTDGEADFGYGDDSDGMEEEEKSEDEDDRDEEDEEGVDTISEGEGNGDRDIEGVEEETDDCPFGRFATSTERLRARVSAGFRELEAEGVFEVDLPVSPSSPPSNQQSSSDGRLSSPPPRSTSPHGGAPNEGVEIETTEAEAARRLQIRLSEIDEMLGRWEREAEEQERQDREDMEMLELLLASTRPRRRLPSRSLSPDYD